MRYYNYSNRPIPCCTTNFNNYYEEGKLIKDAYLLGVPYKRHPHLVIFYNKPFWYIFKRNNFNKLTKVI